MIPGEKRAVPAFNISCTQASTYSGDSIQHISIAGRDKWKNSSSLDKSGTLDLHGLTRAQRRVEVVRHKLEVFLHSSYLEGTYGYQGCLIQWPFFQVGHPSCLSVSHLLLFFIFLSLSLLCTQTLTHPQPSTHMYTGNDYPLQYSRLDNSMDRRAWLAIIHGVTETDTTEQLTLSLFKVQSHECAKR